MKEIREEGEGRVERIEDRGRRRKIEREGGEHDTKSVVVRGGEDAGS